MAVVTVTLALSGVTAHYVFTPNANEDLTGGTGVTAPSIIRGWANPDANSDLINTSVSVDLDDSYLWDVNISFRNAPPIVFQGFTPAAGDLLAQLTSQGWVALLWPVWWPVGAASYRVASHCVASAGLRLTVRLSIFATATRLSLPPRL